MCIGDVRCWQPDHILPAKCLSLENEVVQSSRVIISVARLRPLADSNLDCYREFFQSRAVLIVCQSENTHGSSTSSFSDMIGKRRVNPGNRGQVQNSVS